MNPNINKKTVPKKDNNALKCVRTESTMYSDNNFILYCF